MTLHNFIRESAMADADFEMCDNDENYISIQSNNLFEEDGDEEQGMNAFCDNIANALFIMRGWQVGDTICVDKVVQFVSLWDKFLYIFINICTFSEWLFFVWKKVRLRWAVEMNGCKAEIEYWLDKKMVEIYWTDVQLKQRTASANLKPFSYNPNNTKLIVSS
jgi:hypothetical protein